MILQRSIVTTFVALLLLAGCSGGGDPTAPPSGWQATETRMWHSDVDTAEVFPNLQDLSTMGVTSGEFTLEQGGLSQDQFRDAIKRSLVRLYRNNPALVDTLFEAHAVSVLEDADLSGDVVQEGGQLKPKLLQTNKKKAYQAITDHFREPQREETPDNIPYPDSLRRDEDASGEVQLQVHIDTSGVVDAVEAIRTVHPTLDAIAMKAATETTWEPAYELRDGDWVPVPSWARFSVPFPAPRN